MRRCILLFALLLSACTAITPTVPVTIPASTPAPAATATSAPTTTPTAATSETISAGQSIPQTVQPPPAAVEGDIVGFFLDFIVTKEIRDMADYIETTDPPWVPGPPEASIIIYGPVVHDANHPDWGPNVDDRQPLRVWWYEDDKLAETDQKAEAVARYQDQYMKDPVAQIFAWGYYSFGILSVTEQQNHAQVYVIASCGPLCAHAVLYDVKQTSPGKWLIVDQKLLWGS